MKVALLLTFNYLTYPVSFSFHLLLLKMWIEGTCSEIADLPLIPHLNPGCIFASSPSIFPFCQCITVFVLLWEVPLLWHKLFASNWVISRRWNFGITGPNTELCFMRGQHTHQQSLNFLLSSLIEQNLAMLRHTMWNCYQFNASQENQILLF